MTAGGAERGRRALLAAALGAAAWPPALRAAEGPRRLKWRELMPAGWVPAMYFSGLPEIASTDWSEDDPRARAVLAKMIERGRDAPPRRELDGTEVRIAGFVMPVLAGENDGRRDLNRFLLVPYQGACAHRPPPPANQAIRVEAAPPLPSALVSYPVWVEGRLTLALQHSPFMYTAWRLQARAITRFDEAAEREWLPFYNLF